MDGSTATAGRPPRPPSTASGSRVFSLPPVTTAKLPRCERFVRGSGDDLHRHHHQHRAFMPTAAPPPNMNYLLRTQHGNSYAIVKVLVRDKPFVTILLGARVLPAPHPTSHNQQHNEHKRPVVSEKKTPLLWAPFHRRNRGKKHTTEHPHQQHLGPLVVIKVTHKQAPGCKRGCGGSEALEMAAMEEEAARAEIAGLQLMSGHHHDGLVRLLDAMEDDHGIYAVLPYLPGTDLCDFMVGRADDKTQIRGMPESQVCSVMRQMASALLFMKREHRLAHGDVCLENMMLSSGEGEGCDDLKVTVVDLGLCVRVPPGAIMPLRLALRGRAAYVCPEAVRQGGLVDPFARDVWCLGVMLFMLLLGCPLYSGPSDPAFDFLCHAHLSDGGAGLDALVNQYSQVAAATAAGPRSRRRRARGSGEPSCNSNNNQVTAQQPEEEGEELGEEQSFLSSGARDLLRGMLQPEPSRRLTLEEIVQHPWIMAATTTTASE